MLGKVAQESQRDWDGWFPLVMVAYLAPSHAATKLSPNCLILGTETAMPIDVVQGSAETESVCEMPADEFVDQVAKRMEMAFALAR